MIHLDSSKNPSNLALAKKCDNNQIVNILEFTGHTVSVGITQLCSCGTGNM